jgi:hypothetical protein
MRTTKWIWTEHLNKSRATSISCLWHGGVLGVRWKSKGIHCEASLKKIPYRYWGKA